MDIPNFIAKCMIAGYSYENAWSMLDKAISDGLFDFSIIEDESRFSQVLKELSKNLI